MFIVYHSNNNIPETDIAIKPVIQLKPDRYQSRETEILKILEAQWVLEQSPDELTIQVGSSPDSELPLNFIPVIASGNPVAIYPSQKNAWWPNVKWNINQSVFKSKRGGSGS